MKIVPLKISGAYLIEPELLVDERGCFARTFCKDEFDQLGLTAEFVQSSFSFNDLAGTLRGLHFQVPPHEETKLIRCTMGSIYDVLVDIRTDSPTFKQSVAVELSASNRLAVYAPKGTAHGFQTLENASEVLYMMSTGYVPKAASGIRYDDSQIDIDWPLAVSKISDKDRSLPTLSEFMTTQTDVGA